jgi:heme-degrading monooxygenase HmoA
MFVVMYKFKIKSGMESKFEKAWESMAFEFRDAHGGLGSCLHKDDSGNFVAYARWPNRQLWEKDKEIVNIAAMSAMNECIEQSRSWQS